MSPGYPLIYTSNLNCVYNITTKADVLYINFDDFELENGKCHRQFLSKLPINEFMFRINKLHIRQRNG